MTVYFVDTSHPTAGPALHRHLAGRYPCRRIWTQTHLVAADDPPEVIAGGLTETAGGPRPGGGLTGPSPDWTFLVAALAGTWAGALDPPAARWAARHLAPADGGPARTAVFVAHWNATDMDRRDRPDGFFRSGFRDWIFPSFNTYVLRTRSRAGELVAGVRNKWRGARRGPNAREVVFVAELGGAYAARLSDALTEWLGQRLGAGHDPAPGSSQLGRPGGRDGPGRPDRWGHRGGASPPGGV